MVSPSDVRLRQPFAHTAGLLVGRGRRRVQQTTQPPYDYAREPDPRKNEYRIGPSDVLSITVWHNTDLSGAAIVRPDGTISLPLIGDLRAADGRRRPDPGRDDPAAGGLPQGRGDQ